MSPDVEKDQEQPTEPEQTDEAAPVEAHDEGEDRADQREEDQPAA